MHDLGAQLLDSTMQYPMKEHVIYQRFDAGKLLDYARTRHNYLGANQLPLLVRTILAHC